MRCIIYASTKKLFTLCNTYSFLRKKIRQEKNHFLLWLLVLIVAYYASPKTQVILAKVNEKARTLISIPVNVGPCSLLSRKP